MDNSYHIKRRITLIQIESKFVFIEPVVKSKWTLILQLKFKLKIAATA